MLMTLRTRSFDPANYLDNDEARAAYMTDALATNDPAFIADALGVVARARGMSAVARETGLSRENLYRSLSADGNPELSTLLQVIRALGLRLSATPAES
jgi:probable addiction module antidote protein